MRTSEERVTSLHMRMRALKEKQERRKTAALGAGCGVLAVCLMLLIANLGKSDSGGTPSLYSGATMMFENIGGYVLVAVMAFMLGVVIAVALMKKRNRTENGEKREEKSL